MEKQTKRICLAFILMALLVNFGGIHLAFFTDDPGLYASIAKHMLFTGNYLNLYSYGTEWLDKPHFPFWMAALSFRVFGISTWSYKLPAFVFFMGSLVYTYLFAVKKYSQEIALMSVLILATAEHILMSNADVRAEPYLMGLLMGSIYHISRLERRFKLPDLVLAGLFTACAVMTKGIFVVIPIGGSLLCELACRRRFNELFRLRWLALILVTGIFTLPELYALYVQFDLHPEKVVFGKTHVSGIKWFFWDSQFGRFVNSGPIKRKSGDVFYYAHTLLWAFAPWCLFLFYAMFKNISSFFKPGEEKMPEYYSTGGSLLLLLLFSFSGFQLPFYTNIIFPLFAILTARFLYSPLSAGEKIFVQWAGWVNIVLLFTGVLVINYFLSPASSLFLFIEVPALALLGLFTRNASGAGLQRRIFLYLCAISLFVNTYFTWVIYPDIIASKGQIKAARYLNQLSFSNYRIFNIDDRNNVFQFYCTKPVGRMDLERLRNFRDSCSIFYMTQSSVDYLTANHIHFKIIRSFKNYPKENLVAAFINLKTRHTVLENVYLISR